MLAYERRATLLEILNRTGSITVNQAAHRLGVSKVTIRTDLAQLERQGRLRRVHGGAVLATGKATSETATQPAQRDHQMVATRAAAMVEDGESIVICAGRLCLLLAIALTARRHLKVITNSLDVAHVLTAEATNTVIIVGGVVARSGEVHIDAVTYQSLGPLKAVHAFVTGTNLSASAGLLEESLARAATLRTLIGLADSLVVLLDGDGGSGQGLVSVVPPHGIDHVVVEEQTPPLLIDALRPAGVTVSICGSSVTTVPPRARNRKTYKVAFANLRETELFTLEVRRSIEQAALRAGNIELLLADNHADGEAALRNAVQFIAQHADLVIEYQQDESYAYRLMHLLRQSRIPVIAIDIPHPGAIYFGVDNYVAGRIAGEAMAREIGQRWHGRLDRLFALGLPQSGQTVAARLQGQIDAIRESVPLAPEQITWIESPYTYDMVSRRLREALPAVAIGQRFAVIAVNDEVMLSAIAALEEAGHAGHTIAVSQGADRLALEELLRPGTPLIGAVAFRPETYGERLIALAQDVLSGKEAPPAVYQQHQLIRAADAQTYLDALHARTLKQRAIPGEEVEMPAASG